MIQSMTGFGRCEIEEEDRKVTVELKTVNHRYLDVNIRMPRQLGFLEAQIRNVLREYIQRGKVDLFLTCEDRAENRVSIRYNRETAAAYLELLRQMAQDFGLENDVQAGELSRYPEVLTLEEQEPDGAGLWSTIEKALRGAAERLAAARAAEGERLRDDLLAKLRGMDAQADRIGARAPQIVEAYQERLREKMQELLGEREVDESRLLTEVALFADKVCVDEELVRLKSHIEAARHALTQGDAVGRKLDFIAQEMNREANTILSKTDDLAVSGCAIDLKTEIEKVREQIQNIE